MLVIQITIGLIIIFLTTYIFNSLYLYDIEEYYYFIYGYTISSNLDKLKRVYLLNKNYFIVLNNNELFCEKLNIIFSYYKVKIDNKINYLSKEEYYKYIDWLTETLNKIGNISD